MNKLLSSIIGGFLGATMITAVGVGIGVGSQPLKEASAAALTYQLTIDTDYFNGTSYVANNSEKTTNAICTTDNTKTIAVKWTSNQVMLSSGVMQWQKKNGYIYNSTDLGTITSVTVNSSEGSFTTYYGTSENPTSGTTVGHGFFAVHVGNATGKTSSVVVTFTAEESGGDTPEGVETYRHIFSAKPSTGNNVNLSGIGWNITATNLNGYQSDYAGVQVGAKRSQGSISLTSNKTWGNQTGSDFLGLTVISEIRLWLNCGSNQTLNTISASVGGVSCSKTPASNYIAKKSSPSDYKGTNLFTFTPGNTNTGTVVINVSHNVNLAFYICALEIDCYDPTPTPKYEYKDILTRPTTGIPSEHTTYENWSDKKLTSAARYAGQSAGGYNSIQIRTNNSTSGIVTTVSGGVVKSVKVTFNPNTVTNRSATLYGSGTAYTAASDLFDTSKQGTSLNSFTYDGSETEYSFDVTGKYNFIGIRSAANPIYISRIEIVWESSEELDTIDSLEVKTEPTKLEYGVGETFDTDGMVVEVSYTDTTIDPEETINYSTEPESGYVFKEEDINNSLAVTVASLENPEAKDTFTISVIAAYPNKIHRDIDTNYEASQKLNEGPARFTVTYTDNTKVENIKIGDAKTTLTINDQTVDPTTAVASDYNGRQATLSYTDQGKTVTNTFTIKIVDGISITSFSGVPEHMHKEDTITVTANYVAFLSEAPEVSVQSLDEDNITCTYNNDIVYDAEKCNGVLTLDITSGNNEGQFTIVLTLSKGNVSVSKSLSVIVEESVPEHVDGGVYTKITSLSDIEDGSYVIAANVNSSYYHLGRSVSNYKIHGISLDVNGSGVITSENFYAFDIKSVSGGYTISYGSHYLQYTSSTNISFSDDPYTWSISASDPSYGTFQINTATDNRALIYRTSDAKSDFEQFGGYATSNLNGTNYFNVELFKCDREQPEQGDAFDLVEHFVISYMHMKDISVTDNRDTGNCRGEHGYYAVAKAAWHDMAESYTGRENLQTIFQNDFVDAYQRYITWAEKNGDSQPFVGSTIVPAKAISNITDNGSAPVMVIAISLLTTFSISGYFVLKKKRLHK